MKTLIKSKMISVFPIYLAFGLFCWITFMNDLEPDESQERKPRTLTFEEAVTTDVYGNYILNEERLKKLKRDIENLKNAQQYALRAKFSNWYPCLSCPFRDSIYLKRNEIWKYGITINGEMGRYGNVLEGKRLKYQVQYEGSIEECLIEERKKIIEYPLLEENLKRKKRIARPPGNPKDS